MLPAGLALAVVAGLLQMVTASPSAAVPGSSDPSLAPTMCSSGSVDGLSSTAANRNPKYVALTVPPGGTVNMTGSGTIQMGRYPYPNGNQYSTDYNINAAGWSPDGTQLFSYAAHVGQYTGTTPQPASVSFSGKDMTFGRPWTNRTGQTMVVGTTFWAFSTTDYNPVDWSAEIDIAGSMAGCIPTPESAYFGPNASFGQQCAPCRGGTDYSVDSLTGNEHWAMPPVRLSARGPGIDFRMAYNSAAASQNSTIGFGWHHSFEMGLAQASSGDVTITQETGATVPFSKVVFGDNQSTTSTAYLAPPLFDATLKRNADGTWLFTRRHRELFTFDATGRLTKIADRNGYTTTLSYGASGLSQVVDDAGHRFNLTWQNGRVKTIADVSDATNPRTMTFGYTGGDLTSFTDVGGGAWSMGYDSSHRLQTVQSPRFASTTTVRRFHYDAQGRVDWEEAPSGGRTSLFYNDPQAGSTRIVDPAGNARVDTYNAQGQRTSVTVGHGTAAASTTQYAYDTATGMVTEVIDGNEQHWRSVFADPDNPYWPTKTIDPLGRVRTMTYTKDGDPKTVTDANGITTSYAYTASGDPTITTVADGTPSAATTRYVYGNAAQPGQPTSLVDPRGNSWTYGYDPTTGNLTKVTDPDGKATTWTYWPNGWIRTQVSPRGNAAGAVAADYTTSFTYNAFGQPATVTDPLGHVTSRTYDPDGNLKTVTDATDRTTSYSYTPDGQVATATDGSGTGAARTTTYTYWPNGNLKTYASDPAKVWTSTWDAAGRISEQADPDGGRTTYSYDDAGNLTSTTTAAGTADAATTTTTYDDNGRPLIVTEGDGTSGAIQTTHAYDLPPGTAPCTNPPAGAAYCTTTTIGAAKTVRFFDGRDNLLRLSRPGGKATTYTYDDANAVLTVTEPSGDVTTRTYDATSHVLTSADGTAVDDVTFTYDPNGNRLTMTDATGTTRSTYDRDDRLKTLTNGAGDVVTYGYDAADRRNSLTYPDGRVVTYTRNGAGEITMLTDDTTAAGGQAATFGYSPNGTPTTTNLPNGTVVATTLNNQDQPSRIALRNTAGTALLQLDYTYDHAGRIASETNTGAQTGATVYTYDPADRLKTSTDTITGAVTSYDYDPTSNPIRLGPTTQTFDSSSQLTTATLGATQTTYTHGADGNLTDITPPAGAGSEFTYSRANRMLSSTTPDTGVRRSLYHPLAAARLADTKAGTGSCTPAPCDTLQAQGTLVLDVAGQGGVPATGTNAVTLSITTLNNTGSGLVLAYPDGSPKPDGRSMSTAGGTIQTNTVVAKVGPNGKVAIYSSTGTDLYVDVTGWYADPDSGPDTAGSALVPIDGTRILDTRTSSNIGTCNPAPCARLAAGATTVVQVGGKGGVPSSGVAAVVFTLTAFSPAADGYAIAWPSNQTRPFPRSMSYSAGAASSDLLVVPLSPSGQLSIYSNKAADYTLDLAGYYTTNADGTGSYFVPYDSDTNGAQRILDTRNGTGQCAPATCGTLQNGSPLTVTVAGQGPVPPTGVSATVLSATAWTPSATGALVAWRADTSQPAGRNLSYTSGTTTSGTLSVPLSAHGAIKVATLGSNSNLTLDVEGWFQTVGTTTQTYTYNGDGLRQSKTDTATGHTTHFTYDPTTEVPQLLTDGTHDYIYAPTGAILITAPTRGSPGTRTFHLTDALGSTRATTDPSGAITSTYQYSPFGTVTTHTGVDTPLQYAGGYTDPETDLTYFINRYYNPANGLFTTVDPLLDITNQPYAYVDNNPVNAIDPNGLCGPPCAAAIGFVTGAGMDIGIQALGNLIQGCPAFSNISWGQAFKAGLSGAVFGGAGKYLQRLFALRPAESVRYGPMNAGPLAETIANTFRSGSYTGVTANKPTTLYRVYSGNKELGSYWTRTKPSGPVQSIIDSALDPAWGNRATNWVKVRVPAGTTFYEGAAASQRGLVGGGNQVFVSRVDPSWVVSRGVF